MNIRFAWILILIIAYNIVGLIYLYPSWERCQNRQYLEWYWFYTKSKDPIWCGLCALLINQFSMYYHRYKSEFKILGIILAVTSFCYVFRLYYSIPVDCTFDNDTIYYLIGTVTLILGMILGEIIWKFAKPLHEIVMKRG